MFAKIVPVVFGEKTYYMAYSAWAMFQISDLSEEKQIMEILMDFQAEGFPLFCKAVEIMSKAAENIRAYEGEEKGNVLLADQVMAMAGPMDLLNLKRALAEAVASGYGREIGGLKEEVDLGLCELEKKQTLPCRISVISHDGWPDGQRSTADAAGTGLRFNRAVYEKNRT